MRISRIGAWRSTPTERKGRRFAGHSPFSASAKSRRRTKADESDLKHELEVSTTEF
jgi:hypothetical protein